MPRQPIKRIDLLRRVDGTGRYRTVSPDYLSRLSDRLAADGHRLMLEGADGDESANTVTYWWKRASELYVTCELGDDDPIFDAAHGLTD